LRLLQWASPAVTAETKPAATKHTQPKPSTGPGWTLQAA